MTTPVLSPVPGKELGGRPRSWNLMLTPTQRIGHPAQILEGVPEMGGLPVENHPDVVTSEKGVARLEVPVDKHRARGAGAWARSHPATRSSSGRGSS